MSMKKLIKLSFCFIFLLQAFSVFAVEYDVRTFTLFNIRQRAYALENEKSEFLFYEYIDLSLKEIGTQGLSFSAYGWGRGSSDLVFDEKTENGALSYAVLAYRPRKLRASFEFGRIFSFAGTSFEQFDGFSVSGEFIPAVQIKIFGGSPVNYTFSKAGRGDLLYGARLSTSFKGFFNIGVNYLKEDSDDGVFREEGGIDLWLKPAKFIDLSGHLFYNNITDNVSNYRALLVLRPYKQASFSAELSKFTYSDYFFATPLSVFHFPKGEEIQKLKVGFDLPATKKLSFNLNYHSFEFKQKDSADRYSVEARYGFGDDGSCAGVSLISMSGTDISQEYDEIQSYLFYEKKKFQGSMYFVGTAYDEALFGIKNVYQLLASSGWKFRDGLIISADVQYDKNPQYKQNVSGMLRLKYNFSKKS